MAQFIPPIDPDTMEFGSEADLARAILKQLPAGYLVMHRKAWKTPPDAVVDWPDVDACLPAIVAKLGAPIYRDESIVVFDLGAHR